MDSNVTLLSIARESRPVLDPQTPRLLWVDFSTIFLYFCFSCARKDLEGFIKRGLHASSTTLRRLKLLYLYIHISCTVGREEQHYTRNRPNVKMSKRVRTDGHISKEQYDDQQQQESSADQVGVVYEVSGSSIISNSAGATKGTN